MEYKMSDRNMDAKKLEAKVHDLADAMARVRSDQAMRSDVVVDMKLAAFTRLELLAKDLQSVFEDIPDDSEQFEFALTNGEIPRLWIDITTFVRMGRDKRMYEFVKDTRLGRKILAKSEDRIRIGKAVTAYVAERVLERERAIEGDWMALRDYDFNDAVNEEAQVATQTKPIQEDGYGWKYVGWILLGILVGAAAMIAAAWYGIIPEGLNLIK